MIHRIVPGAHAIVAIFVLGACDGTGSPLPTAPPAASRVSSGEAPSLSKSSPRSGILHASKECSDYRGNAGEHCSITASNVREIEIGSTIYYSSRLVDGKLDSDLILVPPGNGKSVAFGHVTLDLTTTPPHGLVTFSGGRGKFSDFSATVVVSPLNPLNPDFVNWKWDGPYSFVDRHGDSEDGERR
jgi:hypothetical protein